MPKFLDADGKELEKPFKFERFPHIPILKRYYNGKLVDDNGREILPDKTEGDHSRNGDSRRR
jgi:hypothetical protein